MVFHSDEACLAQADVDVPEHLQYSVIWSDPFLMETVTNWRTALKSLEQPLIATEYIWFYAIDQNHSFSTHHIQTRYTQARIRIAQLRNSETPLELLYLAALYEAKNFTYFDGRQKFIAAWKQSQEAFPVITDAEIAELELHIELLSILPDDDSEEMEIEQGTSNARPRKAQSLLEKESAALANVVGIHKTAKKPTPRKFKRPSTRKSVSHSKKHSAFATSKTQRANSTDQPTIEQTTLLDENARVHKSTPVTSNNQPSFLMDLLTEIAGSDGVSELLRRGEDPAPLRMSRRPESDEKRQTMTRSEKRNKAMVTHARTRNIKELAKKAKQSIADDKVWAEVAREATMSFQDFMQALDKLSISEQRAVLDPNSLELDKLQIRERDEESLGSKTRKI